MIPMRKVLVTGANGFVGGALLRHLADSKRFSVLAAVRSGAYPSNQISTVCMGTLSGSTDWSKALDGVDVVLHCAARVHLMQESIQNPLLAFRVVNVEGTMQLARQAAQAGVRRLVFVSSVKVNGELGTMNEQSASSPQDAYALSKMEAEQGLFEIAQTTGMEVVILRPPLVYGPGVQGNFAKMIRWVRRGIPLPLGAVDNRRSLVALDNLVSLMALCARPDETPNAANQVFLVADEETLSTTELLRKLAAAYDVPSRLFPVPTPYLRLAADCLNRSAIADRLLGTLVVDTAKVRCLLGWKPVITLSEQLKKMASHDAFA
jgi:nucleoside-diphosphate-sugar epimerase